jgi:integrase
MVPGHQMLSSRLSAAGFRKAELLTLKVSDVNLLASTLQLRDSKNGEPRKVALTSDAKNLLAACITGKGPEDNVFTRKSGNAVRDFWGNMGKSHPGGWRPWPALSRSAPLCRS